MSTRKKILEKQSTQHALTAQEEKKGSQPESEDRNHASFTSVSSFSD